MPGVVQQYVEAVNEVERYASNHGQDWDVRDAYEDNLRIERQSHPEETYGEAVKHAVETTKHEIRESYDIESERERERESEREMQWEARAEREGIHINQFNARYEPPSSDASEYAQNVFAEESEAFVEKQLRAVDRQFPDATEVEKLRMTEDRLGLDHQASERIQSAYKEVEQPRESNRESVRIQFG